MPAYMSTYRRSLLDQKAFTVTWELVPGPGAFEQTQEQVIASAERVVSGGKVTAVTLTDNPGGNPAISAEMLGAEVSRLGLEPIVHFTCKDKNRNQLEGLLYGLERASVRSLLVMSGDYTYRGYKGRSLPAFDLGPTQLLSLITDLNDGLEVPLLGAMSKLTPTHFAAGAIVNPFKALESEQMGQYYKLKKKLVAGAQYIVTQLGYDARKMHEAALIMRQLGFGHVPLVGTIYVLSPGAARLMNRNGLPGCVVTDELLAKVEQEASTRGRGKAQALERAAKQYALMKGMGYAGAHVGGRTVTYEDVEHIIDRGEELAPHWLDLVHQLHYPQAEGWYYYQLDGQTGLNSTSPTDRSSDRPRKSLSYTIFRALNKALFDPRRPLFSTMQRLAARIDGSRLERTFTRLEHVTKVVTNECLHCGDCALPDAAYVCVTSQCPKNERNGPCGGSHEGWCEVYPHEKQCIYVRAYDRLKASGEEDMLEAYYVPPVNNELRWTSSWLNYYVGRDHTALRLGIKAPQGKKEE